MKQGALGLWGKAPFASGPLNPRTSVLAENRKLRSAIDVAGV